MSSAAQISTKAKPTAQPVSVTAHAQSGLMLRKCACGESAGMDGECEECREKKLTVQRRAINGTPPPAVPPPPSQPSDAGSSVHKGSGVGHDISRIRVSPVPQERMQAKLTVNEPGDKYEQEADRVAEQVMRMAAPEGSKVDQANNFRIQRLTAKAEYIHRQEETGEAEQEEAEESLQTKGTAGQQPEVTPVLQARIDSIRNGGQSLPESTRVLMESRFGYDFSQVRIHTDSQAAETARAVKAKAYTVGRDIVFGAGQYAPGTMAGKVLLAHELTHVVQQRNHLQRVTNNLEISHLTDAAEQQAENVVRAFFQAKPFVVTPQVSKIARKPQESELELDIAQSRLQNEKDDEFLQFIQERTKRINELNETEARVQREILKRFITWTQTHRHTKAFLRASPLKVYERLGREIITPDVERERLRAERAPQAVEDREKKANEFYKLAEKIHLTGRRLPYLIPVPGEHRDILVEDDPAQRALFELVDVELQKWVVKHYWNGDFTLQNPKVVLANILREHEAELRAASLEPLVFESFDRNEIDMGIAARSFATTLGKVLLGAAIVGIVIGAEILTAGQVTWILLGLAGVMGAKAYHDRRKEIEAIGVDVPKADTIVHSAGDAIGVSRAIEGITGLRLGTRRPLGTVARSEAVGDTAANVVGTFVGSRAFKLGKNAGEIWRASNPRASAPKLGGRIPPGLGLPGPKEHFPFAEGNLPTPEAADRIYRIVNNEEAATTLRSGQVPPAQGIGGQMPHKFFSLNSRYPALFKPKALNQVAALYKAGKVAEAQKVLADWHAATGQTIVLEIELKPGALESILKRAVEEPNLKYYNGKDVYIYKAERGSDNIAVPSWQLGNFNSLVKSIRLFGWRAPLGPVPIPQGN